MQEVSREKPVTKAQSVLVQSPNWQEVVQQATSQLAEFGPIDLLVIFASADYAENLPELIRALHEQSGAASSLGCSGQGVIGQEREIEDHRAVSLVALSLPGADLHPVHLTRTQLSLAETSGLPALTGSAGTDVNAWLLLGDPFTLGDPEKMLALFSEAYPKRPLIGGMASGDFQVRKTFLFFNGRVLEEGLLALAVGGAYTLRPVVSQGATPVGQDWMVTAAEGNFIQSISGRPAYEVLVDTFKTLSPAQRYQFQRMPLVGLAVDEYKAGFERGDFIIRQLLGLDPNSGVIAIGDMPRIGQTIQFQLRDAEAADEDLRELLSSAKTGLGETEPLAGILFSCNGRGAGLFGAPDHDAKVVAAKFGKLPLAGFFCNGEIGPVGPKNFLHGFTASLGLFIKKPTTVKQE